MEGLGDAAILAVRVGGGHGELLLRVLFLDKCGDALRKALLPHISGAGMRKGVAPARGKRYSG
ncbi:hypothetical protein NBRC116590_02220 [Pelagimonas sp. KU-00592-HH]